MSDKKSKKKINGWMDVVKKAVEKKRETVGNVKQGRMYKDMRAWK